MREIVELRVQERYAKAVFGNEGKRLGTSVRKIQIDREDARFQRISEMQAELNAKGDAFFFGWNIRRFYSDEEINAAELFQVIPNRYFEPEGEELGTLYDADKACKVCGAGAPRVGPLILKTKRIPPTADIASSIASEIVVSERFATIAKREGMTGFEGEPLFNPGKVLSRSAHWQAFAATNDRVRVVPPTVVADGLFEPGPGPCGCGDLLGLNLISEVSVDRGTLGTADVALTRQFVGVRRGVLRPYRLILVSSKLRAALVSERIRGCYFEVAHLA